MTLKSIINSVFRPEAWCCAVRFNDDDKKCILNDNQSPFIVIPNTKRYWCADPFLIKQDGKAYLFFEAFDRLQKKGVLAYREISNNEFGDIKVIYESKSHLSFPFIYKENGTFFIIPESSKENVIYRLKCTSFPNVWEKDIALIQDRLVDTVFFQDKGVNFYISEKVDESNYFDRVDLFYEQNGKIVECENNPIKRDINNARGAGKIFDFDGKLIRPAQNCGKTYGERLNFNHVIEISEDAFAEELFCDLSVNEIELNVINNFTGIHTYNKCENIEVIDLKLPRQFNLYNFFGSVMKLFNRAFRRV